MAALLLLAALMLPSALAAVDCDVADSLDTSELSLLQVSSSLKPKNATDIFMRYMPSHSFVVCACAKCGSTALWHYLYAQEFGRRYEWTDAPYVHEVTSNRWKGRFVHVKKLAEQERIMRDEFSFALVRDPKERLISAWKTKYACSGMDTKEQQLNVAHLLLLAGWNTNQDCLSLEQFAGALVQVHAVGKEDLLDRYLLPQNLGCFKDFSPAEFSRVARFDELSAFIPLPKGLNKTDIARAQDQTSIDDVVVTAVVHAMLDKVTQDEYAALDGFLPKESAVKEGKPVLQIKDSWLGR